MSSSWQKLAMACSGPILFLKATHFAQVQPANVGGYLAHSTILNRAATRRSLARGLSTICNESDALSTDKVWGNMFRIEVESDAVTLRTTTAYRSWKNQIRGSDLDGLGSLRGALFNVGPTNTFIGFPASVLSGNPLTGAGLGLSRRNGCVPVEPDHSANHTVLVHRAQCAHTKPVEPGN